MDFELTEEIKEKLKNCKTPEEIKQLAQENHIEISMEEINAAFNGKMDPLSDDEIVQAAGGCTGPESDFCRNDFYCT